jgi:hypothetical protein
MQVSQDELMVGVVNSRSLSFRYFRPLRDDENAALDIGNVFVGLNHGSCVTECYESYFQDAELRHPCGF